MTIPRVVGDVEPDVLLAAQPKPILASASRGEKRRGIVLSTGLSSSLALVTANAVAVATSSAATISVGASRFSSRYCGGRAGRARLRPRWSASQANA